MQVVKFGNEYLYYLGEVLRKYKPNNILVLTGKSSFIKSGAEDLIQPFLQQYNCTHYSDFEENPKINDVKKIVSVFNNNNCDFIIAVGGGSVIDMAKLINFFAKKEQPYINRFTETLIDDNKTPFIAIPTTSGTGSEATHFAVVYADKKKYSIADINLLPNYVFLLPELTYSNPKYLSAVTALDAFAQALESYWSVNSTDESISYSRDAIKLIWNNLKRLLELNDKLARDKVMKASYLAGKAINISKTTAPHALSYGFTTYCNLPHGHAVSLFLPAFVNLHCNTNKHSCNDSRGTEWLVKVMSDIASLLEVKESQLANEISIFIKSCGISINYTELKISKQLFEKSIGSLSEERLKNNPIQIDSEFIEKLYESEFNKY